MGIFSQFKLLICLHRRLVDLFPRLIQQESIDLDRWQGYKERMAAEQPACVLLFQQEMTRVKFCMGQANLQSVARINIKMSCCQLNPVDPFDVSSVSKKLQSVHYMMRVAVGGWCKGLYGATWLQSEKHAGGFSGY